MSLLSPILGSIWRYIGPGGGVGEFHKVIFSKPNEVITVGASNAFLGNVEKFSRCFELHKVADGDERKGSK